MPVQSLGQEDPLEEDMATHPNVLTWEIPWTEEPGGATVHGVAESDTTEQLNTHRQIDFIIIVLIFLFDESTILLITKVENFAVNLEDPFSFISV
ncbi:hypothetical protein, partial [Klebsiella pneumoniae]|uniref:hypothetical protein n=1 Tax=Klebsiella pneumoniae TaxID=573 RepID=UPI0039C497B2